MTNFQARHNRARRILKTPIRHGARKDDAFWTQDGRGYSYNWDGSLVRVSDAPPEGYLEKKLKDRDKQAGVR